MRFCSLFLLAFLFPVSIMPPHAQEPHALDAVTYTVEWTYYDGYVAEIGLLLTPNESNTALTDAIGYDPEGELSELTHGELEDTTRVIGSYCEPVFMFEGNDGVTMRGSSGGTLEPAGRGLAHYDFYTLPEGESPKSMDVEVSIGVRTQQETYDEWDTFTVTIPKGAEPLAAGTDINLKGTHVAQFSISRAPDSLVVNILHKPAPDSQARSFGIVLEGVSVQAERMEVGDAESTEGYVQVLKRYTLEEGAPLPDKIRLQYLGSSDALLVDLAAGNFEILAP